MGIKDDDLLKRLSRAGKTPSNNKIYYYIANAQNTIRLRPYQEEYALATDANHTVKLFRDYPVEQETYDNIKQNEQKNNYFTLTLGSGKSYSWFVDIAGNYTLKMNVNHSLPDEPEHTFYLIGNLANAIGGAAWDPLTSSTESGTRLKMARTVYRNQQTQAVDSIVYSATINKPIKGWGELYIGVVPAVNLKDGWDVHQDGSGDWQYVIRPQIDPVVINSKSSKDGTALEGCLWVPYEGVGTHDMALNPIIPEGTESYTFTMNITTSTYRISFHQGLYIMGDALATGDDVSSVWTGAKAQKMTYDAQEGCWIAHVRLVKDKYFRFANDKSMYDCYAENGTRPGTLNTAEAIVKNDNGEDETPYVNVVKWVNEGVQNYNELPSDQQVSETRGSFKSNLPTGDYTLRFYIKSELAGTNPNDISKDQYKVYYTIERPYKLYTPKTNTKPTDTELDGYRYFKAYSSPHAVQLPDGVKMFYVNKVDRVGKVVEIKQLDEDFIPANTPLILASNNEIPSTTAYYDNPWATVELSDNQLRACTYAQHLPLSEGTKENYLFGYKKNDNDDKATLGFYRPGQGNAQAFSAYLQVESQSAVGMEHNTERSLMGYRIGVIHTTGIATLGTQIENRSDAPYYNLQGQRIAQPNKGIYIKNGKKILINEKNR